MHIPKISVSKDKNQWGIDLAFVSFQRAIRSGTTAFSQKQGKALTAAGYEVSAIMQHDKKESLDGVRIVPLPVSMNHFWRYCISPVLLFMKALREHADVYHFHDPELLPVGVLLRLLGKRVIYDVHEDYEPLWIMLWCRRNTTKTSSSNCHGSTFPRQCCRRISRGSLP